MKEQATTYISPERRFFVGSRQYIDVQEVVRLQASSNYTCIYLAAGRRLVVSKTLKALQEQLLQKGFLRVHRGHLVNLLFVKEGTDQSVLELKNGDTIHVSRRKKVQVSRILQGAA